MVQFRALGAGCLLTGTLLACLLFGPTWLLAQSSESIKILSPQINGVAAPDGFVLPVGEVTFTCDIQYSLADENGRIIALQAIDVSDGGTVEGPVPSNAALATHEGFLVENPPGGTLGNVALSFQTTKEVTNVAVVVWLLDEGVVVVAKDRLDYEVAVDEITLSDASPDPSVNLKPEDEVEFSVTVTYELVSESAAELIFEVRDQADENYFFESMDVMRSDGRRQITIKTAKIKIPEADTDMVLKARLGSFTATIKKSNEIIYRIGSDSIEIVNPKVNGIDAPPDGFGLPEGKLTFRCDIEYVLASDKNGGAIFLQAVDVSDGKSKELDQKLVFVDHTLDAKTESNVTLSFEVTETIFSVKIVAALVDSSAEKVLERDMLEYEVPLLDVELGTFVAKSDDDTFETVPELPILSSGLYLSRHAKALRQESNQFGVRVKSDLSGVSEPTTFDLLRYDLKRDGTNEPKAVLVASRTVPGGWDQPMDLVISNQVIPPGVDFWRFRVRMKRASTGNRFSRSIVMPINWLRVLEFSPHLGRTLIKGETISFETKLEFNVNGSASLSVAWKFGIRPPDAKEIAGLGQFSDGFHAPDKPFQFTETIPLDADFSVLFNVFLKGGTVVVDELLGGFLIKDPQVEIPGSPNQTVSSLGIDLTPVQDGANRVVSVTREAGSLVGSGAANSPSPSATQKYEAVASDAEFSVDATMEFLQTSTFWRIDPPVSEEDFRGDLTMHYAPEDLPDDPNFEETNLKAVTLDQQSGELRVLETIVDMDHKTATTRLAGIGPVYGLGVVGPFSHRTLNFPVLRSKFDLFNGLALLNLDKEAASIDLNGYEPIGDKYDNNEEADSILLAPGKQSARLADQLFDFATSNNQGWVQVYSDRKSVVGFELLGNDDLLDGVDVPDVLSDNVVLSRIQYDSLSSTEVHIANPTNFQNSMQLELHSNAGIVGTFEMILAAKEKFTRKIEDIFPGLSNPFLGYLIIRADYQVSVAELLITDATLAALNGQILYVGSDEPTRLYSAQLATGNGAWETRLNVVNPTNRIASLTIRVVGEGGGSLAQPVSVTLQPGEQWEREVGQLFGLDASVLTVGSIVIKSSITGLMGDVTFGDPSSPGVFRASLPLDGTPSKFAAYAQVANGAGFFTGFAAFNPNDSTSRSRCRPTTAMETSPVQQPSRLPREEGSRSSCRRWCPGPMVRWGAISR